MRPHAFLRMTFALAFLALAAALLSPLAAQAAVTVNLQQFDSACGQPQHNCREAFQKAFAQLSKTGGTLQLPSGTFLVDFPEVADNTRSAPPLQRQSLLVVPANVTVQGQLDAKGNPVSIIEWRVTSIPAFIFASASHSDMKNLHFRFIGILPQSYPYGDVAILRALGYKPTFPHVDQMSGGNYEMSTAILLFDSEYCSFDNLTFDSATHDNAHVYGMAINAKAKGVVTGGGMGGLTAPARGNSFTNLRFFDGINYMLLAGQQDLLVSNITADRRGSSAISAPGHLLYLVCNNLFRPDGSVVRHIDNSNITVRGLSEGPDTYSNERSLGTLAVKNVDGGIIENVVSQHPAGLIQTLNSTQNVKFVDLTWSSKKDLCQQDVFSCEVPVLNSAKSPGSDPPNENLTFTNVALTSTLEPVGVNFAGQNITIDGLTIETPPTFHPKQKATNAVLSVSDAHQVSITHYSYIPVIQQAYPRDRYNVPFTCWGQCTDVHADVVVKWPQSVPLPPAGKSLVTSQIQFRHPGDQNAITSKIEPR